MEENLLTILTNRWGRRQSSDSRVAQPANERAEPSGPATIALISSGYASWGAAVGQARLFQERLTGLGWNTELLLTTDRTTGSLSGYYRSFKHQLGRMIELIARQEVLHIFIDRRSAFWTTLLPAVILARFFDRPVIVHLLGDEVTRFGPILARLLKPFLRMTDAIWTSAGGARPLSDRLRMDIRELGPLVDLDSIPHQIVTSLQPAALVDARGLEPEAIQEIVAACQLVKLKYPRCEFSLLVSELDSGTGAIDEPGVTYLTDLSGETEEALLVRSDLFLVGATAVSIDPLLIRAAAYGLPLLAGRRSPLVPLLKEKYHTAPLEFQNRSDLAGLIINLVEQPVLLENCRLRAKSLAEQFASDLATPRLRQEYAAILRSTV